MPTNLYPVDSSVTQGAGIPDADLDKLIAATRTATVAVCDEKITHMTTSTLPNLPAGANNATEALDGTRIIFSDRHQTGGVSVCASAVQTGDRLELAGVQLAGGDTELTPGQARELAHALLQAATLAEQWASEAAKKRHPAGNHN